MDPTAVMGKRIGAWLLDVLIVSVVLIVTFMAVAEEDFFGNMYVSDGGAATMWGIGLLTGVGNHVVLQGVTGGTVGKLMVGLRVVRQDTGAIAGVGKCLLRTVLWVVDGQFVGLVALVTASASNGHRRLGDMASNTLVIDKAYVGSPPLVPGLTVPISAYPNPAAGTPGTPGGPPPSAPIIDAPANYEPPAPDGISAPKWDTDRNAYIQWDPELNQWMEFDESAQQWVPISQ